MKSKIYLLILISLAFSITTFAQTKNLSKNWKKFSKCNVTLFTPRSMRDLKSEQVDSCSADFEDKDLRITLLYGNYGESFGKLDSMTEYKEEAIKIDGRKTQLVTYISNFKDTKNRMQKNYVAVIYVSVITSANGADTITSLVMTIDGKTKKDLETADKSLKLLNLKIKICSSVHISIRDK